MCGPGHPGLLRKVRIFHRNEKGLPFRDRFVPVRGGKPLVLGRFKKGNCKNPDDFCGKGFL